MSYYNINLNLLGRRCAVIGAGTVAYRKINRLIKAGAEIDVYSIDFSNNVLNLKDKCNLIKSSFFKSNTNYFLVIAATDDKSLNERITKYAQLRGSLVNNVSDGILSDFTLTSECASDVLKINISTEGESPLFSYQLRELIDEQYLKKWIQALEIYSLVRKHIHESIIDTDKRIELLRQVNLKEILLLLDNKTNDEILERIYTCLLV